MSDPTRLGSQVARAKELLAEIPKTVAQKTDPVKLGSPVGWVALLPPSP
ncbi:hypothetical protein [Candidatus Methylacidithermus pantelleriae]|nr:hypothetical protein [Candidatus Methylacidithermus pantelleriae]